MPYLFRRGYSQIDRAAMAGSGKPEQCRIGLFQNRTRMGTGHRVQPLQDLAAQGNCAEVVAVLARVGGIGRRGHYRCTHQRDSASCLALDYVDQAC